MLTHVLKSALGYTKFRERTLPTVEMSIVDTMDAIDVFKCISFGVHDACEKRLCRMLSSFVRFSRLVFERRRAVGRCSRRDLNRRSDLHRYVIAAGGIQGCEWRKLCQSKSIL
jgi:hypothetical protein